MTTDRKAHCCMCWETGPAAEMLRVFIDLEADPAASQQWWAHPAGVRNALHPEARGTARDELEALWT